MTDLTQRARDVAGRLKAWGPFASEGYQVPAAGSAMSEAAAIISELVERIEGLEA